MSNADIKSLKIDEKAHGYAKIYASLLKEEYQRKRAYASIAALYSFIDILEKNPCEIQKSMTLFRNPQINEQYEISDLYVNKWHLDVRVVTGGDAVLVPKIHYESNIVPDFYIVIKVDADLKDAELIGIADTATCSKELYDDNYYSIPFSSLIDYETFFDKVKTHKVENFLESEHALFAENYLGLMDDELDLQTKNKILHHLFNCSECRTEFCCFTGFEMVSCNAVRYPDIVEDQTLTIVGAQNVDNKEYEGKEENIYIGDDEENIETQDDAPAETVSDILDELFNIDDDFIDTETTNEKDIDTELNIIEDENNKELEIIEEDESTGLSLVDDDIDMIMEEDFIKDEPSEIEVIDKSQDNILDEEFIILEQPDDINLGAYGNMSEIENISDESSASHGDYIEKVIVDYDETGEPVYSYIANVSQNDSNDEEISEIENISEIEDEDIDENIDFEDIPEEQNNESPVSDNNSEIEDINDEDFDDILDGEFEVYNDDSDIQYEESPMEEVAYEEEAVEDNSDTISYVEETEDIPEEYQEPNEQIENIEYNDDAESIEDMQNFEIENELSDEQEEDGDKLSNNEIYDSEHIDDAQNEEEYEEEDDDENIKQSSSKTAVILASVLILLCLIGGGAFWFLKNNKNNIADNSNENNVIEMQEQQNLSDMFEQNEELPVDENNNIEDKQPVENNQQDNDNDNDNVQITTPLTESDLLPPQQNTNDVGSAIANAFSPTASSVSFRGLNWFCASELFSDRIFKAYLQNLDNILKQNLKTNILNATETPAKNTVSAKFAVDNNGNLKKVIISESCGSEQIDNIVLQSINESFVGEKSQILNDSTLKSDTYYLKVTIKL